MQDKAFLGVICMLLYAALTAISTIFIHDTNQSVAPLLATFYTFSFCLIGYNLSAYLLIRKSTLIKINLAILFILNITTAICWISSFVALKFLPPTLYLFVYLCAMPITSSLIYKADLHRAGLLLIGILLLTASYQVQNITIGFVLAFLGGTSGTIYSIYAKKISHLFKSTEILALRFYLTVLITLIACIYFKEFHLMPLAFYYQYILLSLISIFIPLLLFQMGITYLPVMKALNYLPLTPLICYVLTLIKSTGPINYQQMSLISVLVLGMLITINHKPRKTNESFNNRRKW